MSTQIRKTTSKQKKAISSRERKSCTETGNAAVTELKEFSRSVGAGEDRGEFHVGRGVRGHPSSGVKQRVSKGIGAQWHRLASRSKSGSYHAEVVLKPTHLLEGTRQ